MKTIELKVYSFSELSDEAKKRVIEKMSDINIDYEWYEGIYDDAKNIGLIINSFDIDRASFVKGKFNLSACEVAQNIFIEHGTGCETFNTAENFMAEWQPIFNNYMDENHENYENSESEDEMNELENDFLNSLCEDYRIILSNEYDHLTSEAAIIETIEANDCYFTETGKLYRS